MFLAGVNGNRAGRRCLFGKNALKKCISDGMIEKRQRRTKIPDILHGFYIKYDFILRCTGKIIVEKYIILK